MADMASVASRHLLVRQLNRQPYLPVWQAMSRFTDTRDADSDDQIWLVEHDPVFTQGQAGKPEHVLNAGDIPVIASDRGGQITYHGPGQLVVYPLLNLRRLGLGVRDLVTLIENSVVQTLAGFGVVSAAKADAPGVYVAEQKIASLGLRVRRGCSFHGVAVNIDMDLEPFSRINPCGYAGMEMTQLNALLGDDCPTLNDFKMRYLATLMTLLGYKQETLVLVHGLPNDG